MTKARPRRVLPALLLACMAASPALGGLPKVPDDFRVRLVANVPAVLYPCQVATAPGGDLFVAEDPMDQVGPYESDHGKILLMREGKEPVVFAEGFRAIFGMAFRDGELYVSHMPYLTVLRDADGDGKADSRRELFKDLGIVDNRGLNDHIVSGIQFGIDGMLYISTGDKGILKATGPDGRTAQVVGGGVVRCRPDGTMIEVVSTGTRNHLEPNLDAADHLFTYDNTDDGDGWWTRVTHHVDGGYYGYPYDYHDHPDRFLDRMAEYGGGSPCGGVVYKEDAWPEKFRGRAIWSEWGKRKISAFRFEPAGASYKVVDLIELAEVGDAGEFRPLDVALSYDGKTLYLADWGMGSWGSKTEKVGRVYALTYDGPSVATRARGRDSDPIAAQLAQLDHPSYNERVRAQLALIRAGRAALAPAVAALADPKADPIAARHLVWVVDGIVGGTPEADGPLRLALRSGVPDVRAQAARALGLRRVRTSVDAMTALLVDPVPAVRLQAVIGLGRIADPSSVAPLLPLLTDPDRTLAFSTRQALRRIGDWDAVGSGSKGADAVLRSSILAAAESVYEADAVALLRKTALDGDRDPAERALAVADLALVARKAPPWDGKWWGTRPTHGRPPSRTIAWEETPAILASIVEASVDPALPVRLAAVRAVGTADLRDALGPLRHRYEVEVDDAARQEIARTLGSMDDKPSIPMLVASLYDPSHSESLRAAALGAVEKIGGPEAIPALVGILSSPRIGLKGEPKARVIAALGRFKAKEAAAEVGLGLSDLDPGVRAASAEALPQVGLPRDGAVKLRGLLADPILDVRKAAIAALATLGDRDAVMPLIVLAGVEATRYEATRALAAMPDVRALQVYLGGLADKSQDVRKGCSAAIFAVRDQAEPILALLGSRREIAPAALPELRKIFGPVVPIATWQVLGTYPIDQRPPVRPGLAVNPTSTVPGPDNQPLSWRPIKAATPEGMIDLAGAFSNDTDKRSIFAAAELDSDTARPAQVVLGSDDTLTVWLNGKEVYKFDKDRGFEPEAARVDVELKQGKNLFFVRCGNNGGPWAFSVAVSNAAEHAFLKGPSVEGYNPDRFRLAASKGEGKPDHGKALFADLKGLACIKCHVVGGLGGAIGPDLSGIAARYPRDELITSILYPSQRIFSGYETAVVATGDGRVLTGLIKSDNADGIEIEDADGKKTRVPRADVEDRKVSELSLMPNGIVEGISPGDFADLVAYLETLKDASSNQAKPPGGD